RPPQMPGVLTIRTLSAAGQLVELEGSAVGIVSVVSITLSYRRIVSENKCDFTSEEMGMTPTWQGIYPASTTQFNADQSLNIAATMQHVEKMIAAGMHGIIMLGSVGENTTLEYAEKLDVLKATIETVRRRVPVVTG